MTLLLDINQIVYFYMFICVALLLFNVIYIFRSQGRTRRQQRQSEFWRQQVDQQLELLARGLPPAPYHRSLMIKRLRDVDQLIAYHDAVAPGLGQEPLQRYFDECHDVFQRLAAVYRRQAAMERAFFADLMALYHPRCGSEHDQLVELLLDFLNDSTVYCRENVLHALCAMGSAVGVEHALALFDERGWYHHPRLLSDGLCAFVGDRDALARRLLKAGAHWSEGLQVALVQFAANLSGDFAAQLLPMLESPSTLPETRFALIRYFQRWPWEAARPTLLTLAASQNSTAVAACAALAKYPGGNTARVLQQALHSRNWYVRRNAAASLVALGETRETQAVLTASGDRYAQEMLSYMSQLQSGKEVHA